MIDTFKIIVIAILGCIYSCLEPVYNPMKVLAFVFFYLWYGIEWLVRLIQYRDRLSAYYNISFEREAYSNQSDLGYLRVRKVFQFRKYFKS